MSTNEPLRLLEAACHQGHGDATLDVDPELAERLEALVAQQRRLAEVVRPAHETAARFRLRA